MIQGPHAFEFIHVIGVTYDKWGAQLRQMGCPPTTNGVLSYDRSGAQLRQTGCLREEAYAIYDKGVDLMS